MARMSGGRGGGLEGGLAGRARVGTRAGTRVGQVSPPRQPPPKTHQPSRRQVKALTASMWAPDRPAARSAACESARAARGTSDCLWWCGRGACGRRGGLFSAASGAHATPTRTRGAWPKNHRRPPRRHPSPPPPSCRDRRAAGGGWRVGRGHGYIACGAVRARRARPGGDVRQADRGRGGRHTVRQPKATAAAPHIRPRHPPSLPAYSNTPMPHPGHTAADDGAGCYV